MTDLHDSAHERRFWLRSGLLTLMEKSVGLLFALGTAMMLFRGLDKADFTAWGVYLLITYFLEMGRSGLIQNGMVRYLILHRSDAPAYVAISNAALLISLVFSLLSNLLLWVGIPWLAATYQSPQLAEVLPVYFVTNLLMAGFYHFNFIQQANFEFRGIFWSTFFFRGSLFGWISYCWLSHRPLDLREMAWSMLAGAAVGALVSAWYARPFLKWRNVLDFQWIKTLLSFGKYVLGTNLSTMFYKNIDKLTLGSMLGPAAFAAYDAAGKITQMIETPSFSIAAIVFPQSARKMDTEGPEGVRRLYERSVGAVLALILPFVVLSVLFAQPIIWLFAGSAYAESANVLRLTAFFGLFLPFAVQCGTVLDATGRPALNFAYTLFTAVLNLGLSYLFVARLGLMGAAWATLCGYAVSFALQQYRLARDYGVRWWRAFTHVPAFYRMGVDVLKNRMLAGANK
ncbi:MAG: flippase [Saprospiraceae bacterium]